MVNLPTIEIKELTEYLKDVDNYNDEVFLVGLNRNESSGKRAVVNSESVRIKALSMILVLKGSITITIDYKEYTLRRGSIVSILPTHILSVKSISEDLDGRMLAVSRTFIQTITQALKNRTFSISHMQMIKKPYYQLNEEELTLLNNHLTHISGLTHLDKHTFQKEMILISLLELMLDFANILMTDGALPKDLSLTLTRKEEIFEHFLELIIQFGKEEHSVQFYADKLFITPQYLSLILREQTGQSANRWIDDSLLIEAKTMLKMPDTTVQQVAEALHFADQSTFGKFFKKRVGISPLKFRNS